MKFAVVNGIKVEATKGAYGTCPNCGAQLIAKCGVFKINHWAHKGVRNCDPWWENETEWHRAWKSKFPESWQEIAHVDSLTHEKHIADVKTEHGAVIEFQHSSIHSKERELREKFYKKMVWVVDGTRLTRDYPRFCKAKNEFRATQSKGIFIIDFPDECFPSSWLQSSVPVIFDFRGLVNLEDSKDARQNLYCLFPKANGQFRLLAVLTRELFVDSLINGQFPTKPNSQVSASTHSTPKTNIIVRRRESPYYLERGRWKKRWRF